MFGPAQYDGTARAEKVAPCEEVVLIFIKERRAQGVMRVKLSDGKERLLEFDNSIRPDSSGQPSVIRYIARDVTERKQAERKIRESEEQASRRRS